jgi:hypothetical protein
VYRKAHQVYESLSSTLHEDEVKAVDSKTGSDFFKFLQEQQQQQQQQNTGMETEYLRL